MRVTTERRHECRTARAPSLIPRRAAFHPQALNKCRGDPDIIRRNRRFRRDSAGDGTDSACANSIAVSGGTVYTAGYYFNGMLSAYQPSLA